MVYEAFQPKKFFLVLAGACVALSSLGFLAAGVIPSASTTNHGAYPVTGWIIVACCLGIAAFFVVRALDPRPQLRIDQNGIWYRPYSDATVPWDQIVSCRIIKAGAQKIVGLDLRDPEAWPSKNPLTRMTAGLNRASGFGSLGITATYLTGGPASVAAAVRHYRPDLFAETHRVV
jgi:hypothetical protein